jgi:hypothetical protein
MKYALHVLFFCLNIAAAFPSLASSDIPRDSYYFMLDDGKMSPDEMDEEAVVVYESCNNNLYQKKYFNCECVAGLFRQVREKDGPMRPQDDIVYKLFREEASKKCVNKTDIAGTAYEDCQNYARSFRPHEKDNEEYCGCVARTVVKKFTKKPYLSLSYIGKINSDTMLECRTRDDKGNPAPSNP